MITSVLTEGVFVGEAVAKANTFDMRFRDLRYRPGALWQYFLILDPMQDLPNYSYAALLERSPRADISGKLLVEAFLWGALRPASTGGVGLGLGGVGFGFVGAGVGNAPTLPEILSQNPLRCIHQEEREPKATIK